MVLVEGPAVRVTFACLAASLGLGGVWTQVKSNPEQLAPVVDTLPLHDTISSMFSTGSTADSKTVGADSDSWSLLKEWTVEGLKSSTVWGILLTLPIDFLSLYFLCRRRRDASNECKSDTEATASHRSESDAAVMPAANANATSTRISASTAADDDRDSPASPVSSLSVEDLEEVAPPTNEEDDTEEAATEIATAAPDSIFVDAPPVSHQAGKMKSPADIKAWMARQKEQCEVVENVQASVETDAKACKTDAEVPAPALRVETECVDEALASHKPKRRNAGELKALMEKKRDECHVLESKQEHINTDAKATDTLLKPTAKSNLVITSPKELQDRMSTLRNQCSISESTPEYVATDAKSGPAATHSYSSPNKENYCA